MTTLDKLKTMSDKEIQAWLRKVDSTAKVKDLAIALLGADEGTKNCILRNMSERARVQLAADIEKNKKIKFDAQTISLHTDILPNLG